MLTLPCSVAAAVRFYTVFCFYARQQVASISYRNSLSVSLSVCHDPVPIQAQVI